VVVEGLRRQRTLVAHTVYECPRCEERYLGVRQCPECHLFGRAVGLGGTCPDCDAVILLVDLVGEEVLPAHQ
jgi:transcription initiation factor IIE alpha subunit